MGQVGSKISLFQFFIRNSYAGGSEVEVWGEARTCIIGFKAAQRVPKKVDAVPHHLFKQIANCLDLWHGEFLLLIGAGTLMLRGNEMEIWAPDTQ